MPVATQVPSENYMVPTGSMMRYPIASVVMPLLVCSKILPDFQHFHMQEQVLLVQSFAMVPIATDVKDSHVPSTVCVRNDLTINDVQKSARVRAYPTIPSQECEIPAHAGGFWRCMVSFFLPFRPQSDTTFNEYTSNVVAKTDRKFEQYSDNASMSRACNTGYWF